MDCIDKFPPVKLKTVPYAHQTEVTHRSWHLVFYALLMEMGTGKSKVIVDTAAALVTTKQIDGMLILAPKGVYLNWVKDEIPIHMPDEVDYHIAAWSSTMNREQQAKVDSVLCPITEDNLDILVMNIEALNTERAMHAALAFLNNHSALTVIDESTCIKSPQAERTKRCMTLAKFSKYRRIMTGTPITQSPLDLFTQFNFLRPGVLGFSSFTAFRAYYADMVTMCFGNRSFPKITGFRNMEKLQADIAPYSYRKLKTECLDLPEKVYVTQYFEMSSEQRKVYEKLRDEALVALSDESTVSTTSALTTIMRLQQIACGHVKDDAGVTVDIPNSRMSTLSDVVEGCPGKIIIWANFRRDVELIVQQLRTDYGDESTVHYYGETSEEDRAAALSLFRTHPKCRFFVGTPSTGGRGITLIESSTTIYYSNGYNLEHRLQSEDRNHRIGQTQKVTIIDIVCAKSVDERIVKLLKAKKNLADLVLDSLRTMLADDVPY